MYFEPNPIPFQARAKIVETGLRFTGVTTYEVEAWSRLKEPPAALKLEVVRAFRPDGTDIDPMWWTFGTATAATGSKQKGKKGSSKPWRGPWCVELEFRGGAFTKALDKALQPPLRGFKAQRATAGAISLYRAFGSAERIQLYVVQLDGKNKPIPGSLGGLLIDLDYGK